MTEAEQTVVAAGALSSFWTGLACLKDLEEEFGPPARDVDGVSEPFGEFVAVQDLESLF